MDLMIYFFIITKKFMPESFIGSIRKNRAIKEESREQTVLLTGRTGKELDPIVEHIVLQTEQLLSSNKTWIEEKLRSVREYIGSFSDEEIKNIFFQGLRTHIKQYFRLFKKTDEARLLQFDNEEFGQEIIQSFFVDFVLSLRAYKKQEITPAMALELAAMSYRHNPNSLVELQREFPDVEAGVISRAVLSYPVNPREFINRMKEIITELEIEYPDVERSVISKAAVNYSTKPRAFIERVKKNISELQRDYPDVDLWIIKEVVLTNPTNPKFFIEKVLRIMTELQRDYPDVDIRIIRRTAVHYPSNPRAFIEQKIAKKKVRDING
jgi:hypothetical protein